MMRWANAAKGATLAVAAGSLLTLALATAPGQAEVSSSSASGTWSPTVEITGSGTLTLQTTFNGVPGVRITCDLTLAGNVPSPLPTAAPGQSVEIEQTPPAVLSSSDPADPAYNKCTDTYSEEADDVVTNGAPWTLVATVPATTSPTPWSGSLGGTIEIPAGALSIETPLVPNCTLTGPSTATAITGTYDSSTGRVLADTSPLQSIPVSKTGSCTVGNPAKLVEASATVDPVIDFVYTP